MIDFALEFQKPFRITSSNLNEVGYDQPINSDSYAILSVWDDQDITTDHDQANDSSCTQ